MPIWTPNNRAATTTWLTLRTLAQIPKDEVFKNAGSRKMNQLLFWAKSSSGQIRKVQAESLAIMMDNVFRDIRGAVYEEGVDNSKAIDSIIETLLDSDKTISDLAGINDSIYLFWGEEHNA
jgi:hypothetical protein